MTLRDHIVAEARLWIGTPFHHRERQRGIGVDCDGLLVGVARELRLVPMAFDVPPYTRIPDGKTFLAQCDAFMGRRIPQAELQPGDAVVLIIDKYPQHIGIVGDYRYGGMSIIHASNAPSTQPPRVIETRLMFHRAQKFVAGYVFPGVESCS